MSDFCLSVGHFLLENNTIFFKESMGQVWVLSSFLILFFFVCLFVLKYVLVPVILFLLHLWFACSILRRTFLFQS